MRSEPRGTTSAHPREEEAQGARPAREREPRVEGWADEGELPVGGRTCTCASSASRSRGSSSTGWPRGITICSAASRASCSASRSCASAAAPPLAPPPLAPPPPAAPAPTVTPAACASAIDVSARSVRELLVRARGSAAAGADASASASRAPPGLGSTPRMVRTALGAGRRQGGRDVGGRAAAAAGRSAGDSWAPRGTRRSSVRVGCPPRRSAARGAHLTSMLMDALFTLYTGMPAVAAAPRIQEPAGAGGWVRKEGRVGGGSGEGSVARRRQRDRVCDGRQCQQVFVMWRLSIGVWEGAGEQPGDRLSLDSLRRGGVAEPHRHAGGRRQIAGGAPIAPVCTALHSFVRSTAPGWLGRAVRWPQEARLALRAACSRPQRAPADR